MLPAVGILLSVSGVSIALLALQRLRGESCPSCGTLGTLAVIEKTIEELPGGRATLAQFRQCRRCGASVTEREPLPPVTRWPRLSMLVHYIDR